ncbi:HTH-type transcriptional regulator Hpr [Clostridium homopropionicum DSM 5847]|uniref:HTH-type transcriptional regulator Hpr n=1 Tax=Clostridium homopropionicum DSM 5847 TaxID=1121318 RepID=A0A0L6Z8G8_9CLOT|nr:MarR family transcriptional regulator [Clostridium homopropionicum]KOA19262.1 HTH-type transcriptional regulator Hpr [Clostridium homopropionicum DSM 5847]SFG19098.1 DNA-binding transcriptional regulator, MarR family [Clostridium homopropionicum]
MNNNKLLDTHAFYNLSRYCFLNIEYNYSSVVEASGITLPQLRILWILKAFPGISVGEIATMGYWTCPTVTNILKILAKKHLVVKDETENKKLHKLHVTSEGERYIDINKQGKSNNFHLFDLLNLFNEDELDFIVNFYKDIIIKCGKDHIFEYVDRINSLSLKVDYTKFSVREAKMIKKLVFFYNTLRIFTLHMERDHSLLLRDLNLTYPQLRALWIIEAFPGINSRTLSSLAFWAPSTANLVVKNLYAKDLIFKEKSTVKNSLYLYINSKGEELLIEDFKLNSERLIIHDYLKEIEEKSLNKINNYLYAINKRLQNYMVEIYLEKTNEVIKNYHDKFK